MLSVANYVDNDYFGADCDFLIFSLVSSKWMNLEWTDEAFLNVWRGVLDRKRSQRTQLPKANDRN